MHSLLAGHRAVIEQTVTHRVTGRVTRVTGLSLVADGLSLPVGSLCEIRRRCEEPVAAQVVGFEGDRAILIALHEPVGVAASDPVVSRTGLSIVRVGRGMIGCAIDALGRPIGGKRSFGVEAHYPVYAEAPPAFSRRPIDRPLATGIRSIDALHTLGCGQRMGVFAGTGVGKSVLLGMIAKSTSADVTVVALVGERGREVGEFIRRDLGEEGMKKCVVVVSTSDQSPVLRVRAAFVATAVAEYFRDLGLHVLLLLDSTTRVAMAQRQIGLAAGEPPTTKGYPPSVFGLLPQLLERSGRTRDGSITGLYAVLAEGDDINEPIADAIRGVLDGHLWLSRALANRGHYPAISVAESISRVMRDVVDPNYLEAAAEVRRALAVWNDIEDLVNVGAYAPGENVDFDVAVTMKPEIDSFLRQDIRERCSLEASRDALLHLASRIGNLRQELTRKRTAAPLAKTK